MPYQAGVKRALVQPGQALGHSRLQQAVMVNFEQIEGNEPDRLVGGHPVEVVEAGQANGARKSTQGKLAAQVEVAFEVAESQLPEVAVNGLAATAARVIGLRDGSPGAAHAVDGDYVVGVVLGLQVNHQRWVADYAQSGSGKDGALQAMGSVLAQHAAGRPGGVGQVVIHVIQKALDAMRRLKCA